MSCKKRINSSRRKAWIAIFSLALLLLSPIQTCFAMEFLPLAPSDIMEQIPPLVEESETPTEALPAYSVETETVTVSSFQELSQWLDSHMEVGGRAQLANDITLEKGAYYKYADWWYSPQIYIETGEYTIHVEGKLEIYAGKAHFSGKGGEQGVFHLAESGYLLLSASVEATGGYALYQEEGSLLDFDSSLVQGEIHYTEKPVAWSEYDSAVHFGRAGNIPALVYPFDGDFDSAMLPDSSPAVLYGEGGSDYNVKGIKTLWHTDQFQEQLEANERFVLTGEFTEDVVARGEPAYLVTFLPKDSATFQQCGAQKKPDKLILELYVLLDDPSLEYRLETSKDNEKWEEDGEGIWEEISHNVMLYMGNFPDTGEEMPRYFSVGVVGKDGITRYSDTIELTGNDKLGNWDNGGGRNGETLPGVGSGNSSSGGGWSTDSETDSKPEIEAETETETVAMPPIFWENLALTYKEKTESTAEAIGKIPLPKHLKSEEDVPSMMHNPIKLQEEPQKPKEEAKLGKDKVQPTEKAEIKENQKVFAMGMIALLGVPIYLMLLWKPLRKKYREQKTLY